MTRWVSMKVKSIEGAHLEIEGDGFIAPSYVSVSLLAAREKPDVGDWVQVELDSDDYPITVDHEGGRIWPYSQ